MKLVASFVLLCIFSFSVIAQSANTSTLWRGQLLREDGQSIVFNFEWKTEKNKTVWVIRNASEHLRVTDIQTKGDSLLIQMPLFESQFKIKKDKDGKSLSGVWVKGGSLRTQVMPFVATKSNQRFLGNQASSNNINGRWSVNFMKKKWSGTCYCRIYTTSQLFNRYIFKPYRRLPLPGRCYHKRHVEIVWV